MPKDGTEIDDTFAEAFAVKATRLVITAQTRRWAMIAAREATGYGTSVIGCDAEAGIERLVRPDQSPDGRPGVAVLLFAVSRSKLQQAAVNRVGQCVMTCATAACYDGLPQADRSIGLGGKLRWFGDGFQTSKLIELPATELWPGAEPPNERPADETIEPSDAATPPGSEVARGRRRRLWRIPVMDGEFLCDERAGVADAVAGGNLLILAETQAAGLHAAERAVRAIRAVPDVALPFPGGVVRSGSKVGSKYKRLRASTNDPYCPTLRAVTDSALPVHVNAVYEIVIDGLSLAAVRAGMRAGLKAASGSPGVRRVSAGNYGGTLGAYHIRLRDLAN